ncbi:hypothetical protein FC26_GL000365 [Paucilactobacillus vaccinostercus DSM 20634]|uniref:HTH cro/C1-type domain-containing protein n=1 Tax=Paucilactobacillus vaccinostercus DSM 20634 TaxID=1423813 RepID=A0A0R2ADU6_9LACO|nr:helix-turn-helix transcriptional regulator [Paucilactobacillus vaccinostercus]KRM60876.1 hypothetical protein FC26_GL000365 [Paucilactobacillus vaccinostercus DSM 20634]
MITVNIEKFIETRKKMGLSQAELCDGICTQATLSKFENSGKAPAIRILIQLCARLNLTLDDVFPITLHSQTKQERMLDEAEFMLITSDYEQAKEKLAKIKPEKLTATTKMQYYFVTGYISALTNRPIIDTLFYFDQIINGLDEHHETIYSQLAFTGIGIAYSHDEELDKSEFYFQKVFEGLHELPLTDDKSIWRALNMIFYTAEFFAQIEDYATSDSLLDYGYEVCAKNHITYYVARIRYRQAQNAQATHQPTVAIQDMLNDARAFAKINNNQILLQWINSNELNLK